MRNGIDGQGKRCVPSGAISSLQMVCDGETTNNGLPMTHADEGGESSSRNSVPFDQAAQTNVSTIHRCGDPQRKLQWPVLPAELQDSKE